MPHEKKIALLKEKGHCLNCFRPGHFLKQYPSNQLCRKCEKPHHTWLHIETDIGASKTGIPTSSTKAVSSHASHSEKCDHVLHMTCRVKVIAPNGYTTQARALLDSGSSTSFVSGGLVQHLRLSRTRRSLSISGIGGLEARSAARGLVHFEVTGTRGKGKTIPVEAVVMKTVTNDLPTQPVAYDRKWKHLRGLQLADPDFGRQGSPLGLFSMALRHATFPLHCIHVQ